MEEKVRRVTDRFQGGGDQAPEGALKCKIEQVVTRCVAMMSPDTTIKAKAQDLCITSDVTAQQRMSSPSNARNTIPDHSDTYLAPQFEENFEQVAIATMQEIHRAWDRSLGGIIPSQCVGQSPVRQEKTTDLTEPSGPVLSEAKVRSRVIDIRKDLNTRRNFEQVATELPTACLNGMTWNPATIHQPVPTGSHHLIIGDSLVRDLKDILVVGHTTVVSFGGASVSQVIKMMELQNDDRVDTLTLMIGTNDVSRNPITPEAKWESLLICLLIEMNEKYRPRIVVLCTIPHNPDVGSPVADYMNGNVT